MERIRDLDRYQKGVLIVLLAMLVVFTGIYIHATSQLGYEYLDEIFLPTYENGKTVYSGRLYDADCSFTVTADKVVSFRCEDKFYGPYTAIEDSSAIPEKYTGYANAVGVELRQNGDLLFRGCLMKQDHGFYMFDENGDMFGFSVVATMSDGTQVDESGNVVDPWEPDAYTILKLMGEPELTKKGEWAAWILGVFLSVVTAVSILFADELFRFRFIFHVSNWDQMEPTDWSYFCRYASWTVMPIMVLWVYLMGLK